MNLDDDVEDSLWRMLSLRWGVGDHGWNADDRLLFFLSSCWLLGNCPPWNCSRLRSLSLTSSFPSRYWLRFYVNVLFFPTTLFWFLFFVFICFYTVIKTYPKWLPVQWATPGLSSGLATGYSSRNPCSALGIQASFCFHRICPWCSSTKCCRSAFSAILSLAAFVCFCIIRSRRGSLVICWYSIPNK